MISLWGFLLPQPVLANELPIVQKEEVVEVIEDYSLESPNLALQAELLKEWEVSKIKKKVPTGGNFCSCVLFAKAMTGYNIPVGNARNWPKNSKVPVVGGVVITNESKAGHVAVITKVNPDSIEVVEANYVRCRKGTRQISLNSPVILGYWR